MITTANLTTTLEAPRIFEVYFMTSPSSSSLADLFFNKANKDYHKMYAYTGSVVHLAVRLGAFVYEVTTEGLVKYPWSSKLLDNERIIGYFTADIGHFNENKRLAALFTVENMIGRKLDLRKCLLYYWQTIGFGKSDKQLEYMGLCSRQDQVKCSEGTYTCTSKRKAFYHLPFTCSSPVNSILYHLFGFEPSFAGHLAQSTALSLSILAECGFGNVFDLVTNEYVVGDLSE